MHAAGSMSERNEGKEHAPASVAPKAEGLPPDAALEQLIHDPSPETLRAAAADTRLTEDLALSLLKRRDLPREALESLHKHKSLSKLRKVQLAIVMHPQAPRHVSIPVIRHLYAFELMQVALTPSVAPDIKRAAEEALIARVATISSGERFELAKRSSGRVAAALLLDKEERIMQAALSNPQMTEVAIVKALKTSSGTEAFAPAVSRHPKWALRMDVKIALVANPHTPFARVVQLCSELSSRALREMSNSSTLPPAVKSYLTGVLRTRTR